MPPLGYTVLHPDLDDAPLPALLTKGDAEQLATTLDDATVVSVFADPQVEVEAPAIG